MAKFGYVGNQPDSTPVIVARQINTATGSVGIITFNSGYTPGYLDVFLNGVKLVDAQDYSAADGRTVNIIANAVAGDTIEMVAYKAYNLSTTAVGISSAGTTIKADSVTTLNFIGTGNTFAVRGSTVDISIQGGGAVGVSSNSFNNLVGTGITHFNFVGAAVTALGTGDVGGAKTAVVTVNPTIDYFIVRRPAVGLSTLTVLKTNFMSDIDYTDYSFNPSRQDQFFGPSNLSFSINNSGHLILTFGS